MSVNSKMTALADEIRELSGTEEAMGLDDMVYEVGEANEEVNSQTDLIAQIQSVLEWKGGNGGIKTCTVTLSSFTEFYHISYTAFEGNKIVAKCISKLNTTCTLNNVICDSAISFFNNYDYNGFIHSHDSSLLANTTWHIYTLKAPSEANVNAMITIFDED